MLDEQSDLNKRIADRVRELRAVHGLSLESLAARSGVSRSMISLVERGKSSPTAVVLEKLAAALNVTLASLFEPEPDGQGPPDGPIARRDDQVWWKDPASGYVRRNVSPKNVPHPMRIIEVHFPVGARVAFDVPARDTRVYQQVWVLQGAIDITVGTERYRLREGDCLAMQLDGPTMFHNPAGIPARYAVVQSREMLVRTR